ncbi:ATPase [Actinopolyspora erythraea]|uniref:ATPase n=1 Tax=Actinopolyspora erythraea TaxID=414996 RepID=A0A223RY09_9ACTN|nr:ATPase [Actinopolyspora erythraea]
MRAHLSTSATDHRRGVVRLHPEVLDALGIRGLDAVRLSGARDTVALAATTPVRESTGVVLLDDITLTNAGAREGDELVVTPDPVRPARSLTVSGSRLATVSVTPETLREALTGKALLSGDTVSLLPQDLSGTPSTATSRLRSTLSATIGVTWTNELVTVSDTDPPGAVAVHPATVVRWQREVAVPPASTALSTGPEPDSSAGSANYPTEPGTDAGAAEEPHRVPPVSDLAGGQRSATRLEEWLRLAFEHPELLERLGAPTRLGVLLSGPSGAGKATLVRSVAAAVGAHRVELDGPGTGALEPATAARRVRDALRRAEDETAGGEGCVLLLTDVDGLLPAASPPPLSTVVLDELRRAAEVAGLAIVATSSDPRHVDPRLSEPGLLDRELTVGLPDRAARTELLRVLLRDTPLHSGVDPGELAERTPGFVAADLAALTREAAVQAALRHRAEPDDGEPRVRREDFEQALSSVRPISMSTTDTLRTGEVGLDDVGDMVEVKQALHETVLWPLRYPDSFARLGIRPARGVLLYGPPGCGKTFLVRALAGTGRLNAVAVKGAELLDKWVGESERAVRDLFTRAADAAPTLVFLDEIDALAPVRGQSSDSGVTDRVVAALLTELDGVEPMRDVVVIGATNRPELVDPALLRPGRLERSVGVPPPDAAARAEILRSAGRNTPFAGDVDLAGLAESLEGYSAADCASLIREAALTALRETLHAAEVSAAHLESARERVRPSLSQEQLAAFESFQ